MHILFADESGTPPHPGQVSQRYFVIGGVILKVFGIVYGTPFLA
jgi:hypothetical protein